MQTFPNVCIIAWKSSAKIFLINAVPLCRFQNRPWKSVWIDSSTTWNMVQKSILIIIWGLPLRLHGIRGTLPRTFCWGETQSVGSWRICHGDSILYTVTTSYLIRKALEQLQVRKHENTYVLHPPNTESLIRQDIFCCPVGKLVYWTLFRLIRFSEYSCQW